MFSSLSESGFIPTEIFANNSAIWERIEFSSLSESGFIPTKDLLDMLTEELRKVLISFREWLHSYNMGATLALFFIYFVLISFREWLHSYLKC